MALFRDLGFVLDNSDYSVIELIPHQVTVVCDKAFPFVLRTSVIASQDSQKRLN
jgi:hypothetical protein